MELVYVGVISFVLVLRTVRRMRTALLEVYVVLGLAVPETFVLFWTVLIQYISSKNWLRGSLQGSDDHR
jgi:4-amino-4-deoxy-L-arabinose transferase-like glycosyltransferase